MVEIQLTHPLPCDAVKGCASVQVLAERIDGLEEQERRHEAMFIRLFERLDGIYKQNVAILLGVLAALGGITAGLIGILLKR